VLAKIPPKIATCQPDASTDDFGPNGTTNPSVRVRNSPARALPGNCLGEQQAWRRFGFSEEVMIAIGTLCLVLSAV